VICNLRVYSTVQEKGRIRVASLRDIQVMKSFKFVTELSWVQGQQQPMHFYLL